MINCEHPVFMINPYIDRIGHYHGYVRMKNGKRFYGPVDPDQINEDNVDQYTIMDKVTHEIHPMYMAHPCGHCSLCADRKRQSIVRRMCYQANECDGHIYFVTLTYDDDHLPPEYAIQQRMRVHNKTAIANYIRSVKKYIQEHFNFNTRRLPYFYVSEEGRDNGRPHFHLVFFGLPLFTPDQQSEIFHGRWMKGEPRYCKIACLTNCGPWDKHTNIGATIQYVTKYVNKSTAEKGPFEFHGYSQGLGAKFLRRLTKHVLAHPEHPELLYYDYPTGKYNKIVIDRSFIYYVFERKFYKKYLDARDWLEANGNSITKQKIQEKVRIQKTINPRYAPVIVDWKKHALSPSDYKKSIECIEAMETYSYYMSKRDIFLKSMEKDIDPDTFKQLRYEKKQRIEKHIMKLKEKEII